MEKINELAEKLVAEHFPEGAEEGVQVGGLRLRRASVRGSGSRAKWPRSSACRKLSSEPFTVLLLPSHMLAHTPVPLSLFRTA